MAERWLLISIATSRDSSTLRVYAWRRLRTLGAHYLQQSVCLLPQRPGTVRAVNRLMARVRDAGAQGRVLHIEMPDEREERELIAAFSAERSDEYAEVVARAPAFLEELALERRRGRATYTEVEESEADLQRLQRWLRTIRSRDYFSAPGQDEAAAAVERCEQALGEFEAEAFAREQSDAEPGEARVRTRLRVVDDDRG